MAVSSPSFTFSAAMRRPCEMQVAHDVRMDLMSFWYFESRFMISRIGVRSKWHVTSPSLEYEMRVTSRLYCEYSSSVSTFRSVSLVDGRSEYMEPERSTTMMLWATAFLLLAGSRGSSAG